MNMWRKKEMKKVSKPKNVQKNMIKEALADINREILNISLEKKKLNKQIKGVDTDLDKSIGFEKNLQQEIAKLVEKEASLKEKKKRVFQEGDKLVDRLSKIEKVKFELNDL
jgi:chromosome segregation ATPase